MGDIDKNSPIGVFDSGVGGLTVVKELMEQLPNERIIYYGDTARVPYGNKSRETVIRYSREITDFLVGQNVKAIVVACNTASALALDELTGYVNVPIIGVVKPGARAAAAASKTGKIGVIATRATVSSGIYEAYLKQKSPDLKVFAKACPLFVPLVEEGLTDDPITDSIIHRYLDELLEKGIDSLVLGCTHYPLLKDSIARAVGKSVTLVNPAYETARSFKALLEEKELLCETKDKDGQNPVNTFFVSDSPDQFRSFAGNVLSIKIGTGDVRVKAFAG
ncbi:MAG: glutamate racemase [Lachnospiraceae bacterium]|nr:glutamate racemase [Lachnospiraceae bacterium]